MSTTEAATSDVSCAVCGGGTRLLVSTANGFDLLRCVECRLVLCSPMPTPAELDAFYQGFAYSKPEEGEFQRQVAYTERGLRRVVGDLRRYSSSEIRRVLDFGGGLGFFANALSQHFPDVALFDLDGHAREFARERFDGRFVVYDDASAALAETYDLILLNQVIEHVPDPIAFLASFKHSLAPGGVLIVTTPNNRTNDMFGRPDVLLHYARSIGVPPARAALRMARDSWLCCDPPRHLFAFSDCNLEQAAAAAGFLTLSISTSYFDQDPYGQPKYAFRGFGSMQQAAKSLLFAIAGVTMPFVRLPDRGKAKGTTLIGYFKAGGAVSPD